jgi:dolichol-phosphate mannosyltransferase
MSAAGDPTVHHADPPPDLSLVIPTRNERGNVSRLLDELRAALSGLDYETIFVDDSTDGTDAALAALARGDARIRVLHRARGDGLAGAVVAGFGLARGAIVGVIDADLQHPPSLVPSLVRRLDEAGADIAVASRYLPGAGRPGLSWWRRIISQATRLLAWSMLRAARRSSDPLSGFFVVRRTVVDGVPLRPVGFKILLEILCRGRYERVVEVPYVFARRGGGQTKATLRQGLDLLRHVVLLAAESPADSRIWKFFLVGASGVAVNMVVFWFLTQGLGVHYLASGTVAGLVSTFTNFLLNNAFTWADRRERAPRVFVQRLGKYYIATWGGYLVYLGILWGLTHAVGLVPLLSNLIAVGIGGLLNYAMHNVWTWRAQRAQ